jgi:molecular chaperone DnaK
MSNWLSSLKRLSRVWGAPLIRLVRKLQGLGEPSKQLGRTCKRLQQQLESPQKKEQAWQTYTKALSLARKCDRHQLTEVILRFDSLLGEGNSDGSSDIGQAISFLIEAKPQNCQNLDAAWRLSQRLNESSSIRQVQQEICLQVARVGEGNFLLTKLLSRYQEGYLSGEEVSQIINTFLENHNFELVDAWKGFFEQLKPNEVPKNHIVYALLERYMEAADIAEENKDYRSAINYLMHLSGKEIAFRILALSNRLGDETAIAQACEKVAESFYQEGNYIDALENFQKAGNLQGASDCYQKLCQVALAIKCRPNITDDWIQDIRSSLDSTVRQHIQNREYIEAVSLLKTVAEAWQEKSQEKEQLRTQRFLSEAVKTARSGFATELQNTDLFKRWSLMEEAAGNYLEAGLQAEKAEDYFGASVLFEKANAFGQALVALDSAEDVEPRKKAELLELGGDFYMAALLYEKLQDTDKAIALYENAGEFLRAAELRKLQLNDEEIVFDSRFQDLLTQAGKVEQLAELCATKAFTPGQSAEEKARFWRRIKDLAEQGLIGKKWLDMAANELPAIEVLNRSRFEQQADAWVKTATRKVLADYINAIGLDLGTTNSVVSLYNLNKFQPEVVERGRQRQIPSVFAIDNSGKELVGVPISELLSKSPRAIITKAKREMGTNRKFKAGGVEYRAEEISARIINYAREFAREYLQKKILSKVSTIAAKAMGSTPPTDWVNEFIEQNKPVIPLSNIVITVPAYFNEAQKQATKTAGTLADIRVLRLIHEPTAACLAQRIQESKAETILVADLGAGTFDLSIIQAGDGVFEVQEIEGDNALGSADLDEIIYTHFSEIIKADTEEEIPRNSQAATRLRQACEELKIELSSQSEWTIDLPYLINNRTIQLSLTRDELENLASSWLQQIRTTCLKIQQKPSRVLLIGGGALMPAVPRILEEVFKLKPDSAYDPLTVVARGASLQAAILMGEVKETVLLDVVPFSLGIECYVAPDEFKFDSIIPRHTAIPSDRIKRYTTTEDGQTAIRIKVFQGESSLPEENFKIGEFILQGIPIAKAGVPQIDVKFDIDSNCLLTVTARDASTGNQQSITIADSHLLTPAQMTALQTKFKDSQFYQVTLNNLKKLAEKLKANATEVEKIDILNLSTRFQNRIQVYEQNRERYLPTATDNNTLFEIYRDKFELEEKTRLALDKWGTLSRSLNLWLNNYGSLDWRTPQIETEVGSLFESGNPLLKRVEDAKIDVTDIAANYQKWLSTIENLPLNFTGNAEELAQHFLSLQRYSEALAQFQRFDSPLATNQIELGLEILARNRQRDAYTELLLEHSSILDIHKPDFENLNYAVRTFSLSVVLIQVNLSSGIASGSGFAIGSNYIATNLHVVLNEITNNCVAPEDINIITTEGNLRVKSIHVPSWGTDDVAILQIEPESTTSLKPLRLGFSELVEVGERIMTIGFPAPESGEFAENLYCNKGLVNRIRASQLCSERVLEVSIPLQGGISGAPILNQFGEVIGLLTFWRERKQGFGSEKSFYAIPVELLRRLQGEISD